MISHRELRKALRKPFLDGALAGFNDNVAWENHVFDSSNKSLWLQEKLLPASDQANCDTTEGNIGIYQLTVFVPSGEGIGTDSNPSTLEIETDIIAELYNPNLGEITQDNIRIVIDSVDGLPIDKDENWQFKAISIIYRAFELN